LKPRWTGGRPVRVGSTAIFRARRRARGALDPAFPKAPAAQKNACAVLQALSYSAGMNIQVAVLCDAATDEAGKLNLLGAFDTIYTQQLPAVHPQCSVALRVTFGHQDEGEHTLRLNFVDADGRPIMPPIDIPVKVALPGDSHFGTRNFIVNIQQLRFELPGLYSLDISLNGHSQASIPLLVKQLPLQPNAE